MQFDQQLMQIFQQQYSNQTSVLNFLKGQLQPQITNPTGYDTATLNAMRTSATDADSEAFQNAQQTLNAKDAEQLGGSDVLPSGVSSQLQAALLNQEAQTKAADQNQITVNNANLAEQNKWAAVNALNGVAAQVNPLGYANSATEGSNAVSNLSQAVTASNQSQLLGALGGIAGGVGSALGGAFAGGKLCWVAAAYFDGWTDPRTVLVRHYLLNDFSRSWFGRLVVHLYRRFGERISRKPRLVKLLGPLFELALKKAQEIYGRD